MNAQIINEQRAWLKQRYGDAWRVPFENWLIDQLSSLQAERGGLREERDKAREGEQASTQQKAQFFAEFERLRTEAATAQVAEARLRGIAKELFDSFRLKTTYSVEEGEWHKKKVAEYDAALSTPPTAALPDGEDSKIVDWLETQIVQGRFYRGVGEDTQWRDSHKSGARFPTFRAAALAAIEEDGK